MKTLKSLGVLLAVLVSSVGLTACSTDHYDLTKLKPSTAFGTLVDMMNYTGSYVGKTVKMQGLYIKDQGFDCVFVTDPDATCVGCPDATLKINIDNVDSEFLLVNQIITIEGTFVKHTEGYYYIDVTFLDFERIKTGNDEENIDIDLTLLAPLIAFAQVQTMLVSPGEYLNKTIKMEGQLSKCWDNNRYFDCLSVNDPNPAGCCGTVMMKIEIDSQTLALLEIGDSITIQGTFKLHTDGYYYIQVSLVTVTSAVLDKEEVLDLTAIPNPVAHFNMVFSIVSNPMTYVGTTIKVQGVYQTGVFDFFFFDCPVPDCVCGGRSLRFKYDGDTNFVAGDNIVIEGKYRGHSTGYFYVDVSSLTVL